jgi:MFS family permease
VVIIHRRWVFWVMTAFAGFCFLQIVFTLPETYAPVILLKKAKRLRKETGDQNYYAPLEKEDRITLARRVNNVLGRPFAILIREPMLIAITVYMSFVYGCLYLLFEAYPIVFTKGHHFNAGISGLMFLPLPVGGMAAVISVRSLCQYMPRDELMYRSTVPHLLQSSLRAGHCEICTPPSTP